MRNDYVFVHAIGNDNFEKFIDKTLDGTIGQNFNAFYIPETTDVRKRFPTLTPQWPSHKGSILVAFEGSNIVFEGGF